MAATVISAELVRVDDPLNFTERARALSGQAAQFGRPGHVTKCMCAGQRVPAADELSSSTLRRSRSMSRGAGPQ